MHSPVLNKKAAEMSLNVIVIAIIVLIVLIVLVIIFGGRLNVFGKTTVDCRTQGGYCTSSIKTEQIGDQKIFYCTESGETAIKNTNCPEGQGCCIAILK